MAELERPFRCEMNKFRAAESSRFACGLPYCTFPWLQCVELSRPPSTSES